MTLETQIVPLKFSDGLDQKEDEKTLPLFKLRRLSNAVRRKKNRIQKRFGSSTLGSSIIGSSSVLENVDALGVLTDELTAFSKQSVYAYSENADKWSDRGAAISARVRRVDLVKNNYEQTQVDGAVTSNIALTAWEDARGGVRCSVYDIDSGSFLLSDSSVNASGTRPRCVAFGGFLFVLYVVGNDLRGRVVNPINPSPLGSEVIISSAVNSTNCHLDVIATDTYILACFNVTAATQIRAFKLNNALAIQATVNIAEAADNALAVFLGPMSKPFFVWHNGTGVRCAIYDIFLVSLVSPFTVDATAGTVKRITGYQLPDGTGGRVFYEYSAASTYDQFIRHNTVTTAGVAGTSAVFLRSVGIASKAWAYSPDTTDKGFLCVTHESTLQSTFFVVRSDGYVAAKSSYGTGGGLLLRSLPAVVSELSAGVYWFPVLTKNPTVESNDFSFLTFKGISAIKIDFTDLNNFANTQLGNIVILTGGVTSVYDGVSVFEQNYHLFPENISSAQSTGGSLTLLGTYSYKVTYEWTDANGEIHRSAPSIPISVTLTGGNNRVTLTIPTLRLTEKKGNRTNVNIVVYRTETLGEVYYKASSSSSLTYNDTTVDTVSVVDDLSDTTLISREPLYTEGGVIENTGAPSAAFATNYKRRIILAGTEDDAIWPSKPIELGKPVEFSDSFTIPVDKANGRTTGVATIDETLVLFKENSIYSTSGDGPDATGLGGYFPPLDILSSDTGCIDENSIELIPSGLIFKSRKGIYLLGRDLSLSYVGAAVEDYNDLTISSAVVMGDVNEVRFTTTEGTALVYNYEFDLWSTFENYSSSDAINWRGQYIYIRRFPDAYSRVCREDVESYLDIGQKYGMKIETGWLSLAGLQAIQRVRRAILLGAYKSAHKLRVRIAYDFNPAWVEEHYWNPSEELGLTTYGEDSPYGIGDEYGGSSNVYQPRIHLANQKCESVKFLIEDVSQDEASYESFNLSGISLEVGVKKGTWKTRAEHNI